MALAVIDTMRGGLVDDAGQCAKLLDAGSYSRVVQRICHLGLSFGWDFMGETIGEAWFSCQQAYPYPIWGACCGRDGQCLQLAVAEESSTDSPHIG